MPSIYIKYVFQIHSVLEKSFYLSKCIFLNFIVSFTIFLSNLFTNVLENLGNNNLLKIRMFYIHHFYFRGKFFLVATHRQTVPVVYVIGLVIYLIFLQSDNSFIL